MYRLPVKCVKYTNNINNHNCSYLAANWRNQQCLVSNYLSNEFQPANIFLMQDFIIKLLKLTDLVTGQIYNIVLVIIDKLTKWGYFIIYIKEILIEDVVKIYIKEVFLRHRALNKIILDRDLRFILVFQEVFLAE